MLLLRGCRDANTTATPIGLFPEILRNDLHGVRSTIERYSQGARLGVSEGPLACGVVIGEHSSAVHMILAITNGIEQVIKIDRWD